MTHEEAIAARNNIAGRVSMDTSAVLRCAERGDGCVVRAFGTPLTPEQDASASVMQLEGYAGNAWPCDRHKPSKRHAWVHDVPTAALMAQTSAFAIDDLRCYLPRNHPEYRG